jgi:AsmA family protein
MAPDRGPMISNLLPRLRRHPKLWVTAGITATLAIVLAAGEASGWPLLANPAARWLGDRLQRRISFEDGLRLYLLGGIRLEAAHVQVDNPAWSRLGPMLVARNATLKLRYGDMIALRSGAPLHVDVLDADSLVLAIERRADGAASWQFGERQPTGEPPRFSGVRFRELAVREGRATVADALLELRATAEFGLASEGDAQAGAKLPASAAAGSGARHVFRGRADGTFHRLPLKATLRAGAAHDGARPAQRPVELRVQIGPARLAFDGGVSEPFGELGLDGRYELSGDSLAAVGDPLGVTLPTTDAFSMQGTIERVGSHWHTVVDRARIGLSELNGDFTFDTEPGKLPMLTGRLGGPMLALRDLGPAVGTPTSNAAAARNQGGAVLPKREFDLPSLRAMNADVAVSIARADFGTQRLQAIEPLLSHIRLQEGVLTIDPIDARLAQGHIRGNIRLDGRGSIALWEAQFTGTGLRIEQWLAQPRPQRAPVVAPYVTGRLGARIDISGRGRSSAQLLASANGRAIAHWTGGGISHLVVEAAGLDIAQALGVRVRGDKLLPVTCAAADLAIAQGQVVPTVMLVDTPDSTLWLAGSVSLATEEMHLVATVSPKDASPLSLRAPLHVDGRLNAPKISIEKKSVLRRVGAAVVLATVNPVAAIIPFIDLGDDESKKAVAACQSVPGRAEK